MKKSHKWDMMESIEVRCPYCGYRFAKDGYYDIGDEMRCHYCDKEFELGQPK